MKIKKNIKESREKHFKLRWLQRVGYNISNENYLKLNDSIQKTGKFLYRQEGSSNSVYGICFEGMKIKVVYNIYDSQLITVLQR